ncbi:hypothetical protein ABN028_32480 [Actinopolymorpha sp. B17G11]
MTGFPATGRCVALTKNRFNPTEINAFEQVSDLVTSHWKAGANA